MGRFPGFRVQGTTPCDLPGLPLLWRVTIEMGRSRTGYSGGTAPDLHRLPFYPAMRAPIGSRPARQCRGEAGASSRGRGGLSVRRGPGLVALLGLRGPEIEDLRALRDHDAVS